MGKCTCCKCGDVHEKQVSVEVRIHEVLNRYYERGRQAWLSIHSIGVGGEDWGELTSCLGRTGCSEVTFSAWGRVHKVRKCSGLSKGFIALIV